VGVIAPMIRTAEMERLRRKRPENMAAYDSVVRALPQLLSMSETASREALRLSMEATRFDPGYARAYALAAWCHSWRISNDWVESRGEARSEGMRVAREALRLNDEDPGVLIEAGTAEATLLGNVEAAAIHVAKALVIDPNSAFGWIRSGYLQAFLGHTDQALEQFERAGRLSPFDPLTFYLQSGRALAHFIAGRYLEAAEWSGMALTERPGLPWGLRILAASQQMLGRRDDAAAAARRLLAESPTASIATALECMPFRGEDARQRFAGALRAAGVSERGTGTGNLKVVA
jgi:adenylate cyclase